jgi:hypothetical protein
MAVKRLARLVSEQKSMKSEWVDMGDVSHAEAARRLAEVNSYSGIVQTRDVSGLTIFNHLVEPTTTYKVTSYRGDD